MSATVGPGVTPAQFGRYRLCTELGRGGMGVVHLALDERGRAVALKVLRDPLLDDPAARARLAREVDHLSRIQHPGVAGVLDADVHGERPYVVTRYVRGPSLERYIAAHGPLRPPELLSFARDLSDAIGAVHAAGVVHRDLKPANVLVHEGRPVLIDFGIAHAVGDTRLTSTGLVMGTPGFLAPEILDGAVVTPATDWWAWAATLAFAASGRVPFGEGPVGAVLARIRAGECDLSGVDPQLAPLLRAALSPDPRSRPGQGDILAALARYGDDGPPTAVLPAMPTTQVLPEIPTSPAGFGAPLAGTYAGPGPAMANPAMANPVGASPAMTNPVGAGPVGASPVGVARRPRAGVVLALATLLIGVALVAPGLALATGVGLSFVARTVDRAAVGLLLRRSEYGPRRGDVLRAALRSPAYAVAAALASLGGSLLPALAGAGGVVGGIALQGAGVLPGSPMNPSASAPLLVGSVAALVVGWWGPGARPVRRGTRLTLWAVGRGRYGGMVTAGVLLVGAAWLALVAQSSGFEVTWTPFTTDPFSWVRSVGVWG